MRKFLWPVLLLVAGCAVPPRGPVPPPAPAPAPAAPRPAAPAETWQVVASRLEVRVYRDGPMQKLGHNHVITSDQLRGEIMLRASLTDTSFELRLPLESLVVDDEAARSGAGPEFSAPVPEKDRDATRHNMLGDRLLNAALQPEMRLTSDSVTFGQGRYEARVRVALAGGEHIVTAPFTVTVDGGRLSAHGAFRLNHADVGLEPFAVAFGALKVRDDFDVDLRLEARRGS
jgi:polyisoprenoid-binding protein YceI